MKLLVSNANADLSEQAIRNVMADPSASRDSVRKGVSRLRETLRQHELGDLADRIKPSKGLKRHYRLDLD
jgi:hypothetical protein